METRRKRGLTLDQHNDIAEQLQGIRDRLLTISTTINNAYPLASLQARKSDRAFHVVDELRSLLEGALRREHPYAGGPGYYLANQHVTSTQPG